MAGPPGGIGQFAQRHVAQGTKFNQEHALTPLLSTAGGLARDRCSKVDPVRKQSIVPVSEKNSLLLLLILLLSAVLLLLLLLVQLINGFLLKLLQLGINNTIITITNNFQLQLQLQLQ